MVESLNNYIRVKTEDLNPQGRGKILKPQISWQRRHEGWSVLSISTFLKIKYDGSKSPPCLDDAKAKYALLKAEKANTWLHKMQQVSTMI